MRVGVSLGLLLLPLAVAVAPLPGAASDGPVPTPPGLPTVAGGTAPAATPVVTLPTPPGLPSVPPGTTLPATLPASVPTPPPSAAPPTVVLPTAVPVPTATVTLPATPAPTRGAPPTVAPTPSGTPVTTATATVAACAPGTGVATGTGTATGTTAPCAPATATATATAPAAPPPTCATAPSGDTRAMLAPAQAQREIAALRSRTARVYDMGDGTMKQVLTTGSVNYQDAQGKWQPIDNTLVAATQGGYAYQNKANGYGLALPADLGANPVTITRGKTSVSFALVGAAGAPTPCGTSATYANALPGVSVTYVSGGDGVAETLTLASARAPRTFTFTVQTTGGLTARATQAGGVAFVDGAGTVQFTFAAPFLFDSATPKPARSTAVTLQLGQTASGLTATLAADAAWLADPARVYPVMLDPSVTITGATQDCFMTSSDPTYTECDFGAGRHYGLMSVGQVGSTTWRGLVQFDLRDVPINAQIKDAEVQLYEVESAIGQAPVSVYKVTNGWYAPQVSWQSRDGTNNWNTAGGDYDGTAIATTTVGPYFSTWYAWKITQLARGWLNGTVPNNGMLFAKDGGQETEFRFGGTSYWNSTGNYPKLTITYPILDSELGERRFYTLAGGTLDDRLGVAVNPVTGNLLAVASDFAMPGTGLGLTINRTYNSLMDARGLFGNRWTMSIGDQRLRILSNGNAVYQGSSGYQTTYTKNGSAFDAPPEADSDLTFDGANTYTLTFRSSRVRSTFNNQYTADAVLVSIKDQNNNEIGFTHSGGRLWQIGDTQGRSVTFTYNAQGFIETLTDTTLGRVWRYDYDPRGNLTRVTEPVSAGVTRTTQYEYDGSNNLTQITDPRGGVTTFRYPTPDTYAIVDRVTRVYTGDATKNAVTSFTYNGNSTVITDANGHQTTVAFDPTTDLVTQVTDALGNSQWFTYTSNPDTKRIKTRTDGNGKVTTYDYDGDNRRVVAVRLPTGATTTTAYDDPRFPFFPTTITDAQGRAVRYTYDANGNRVTVQNDLASENTVTTAYNANGTVQQVTDARGAVTRYDYTYTGTILTKLEVKAPPVTSGTRIGTVTTNYDGVGRTTSASDGTGRTGSYTYDYLNRTKTVQFTDATGTVSVSYTYDSNGNMTQRGDATGTTTYTFDPLNRLTSKVLPASLGGTTAYTYDTLGNMTGYTDAGGSVAYEYDAADRLTKVTEPGNLQTTFGYDRNNQHTTTVYPSGIATLTLTYDDSQRLTSIAATDASNATLTRFTYSYQGASGDSGLRQRVVDDDAQTTTTYTYDAVNRLTRARTTLTATPTTEKSDYQYAYDGNGNRTSSTTGGAVATYAYNEDNILLQWNTGQAITYQYDAAGNEVGGSNGTAFAYNAASQTTSITGAFGTAITQIGYADAGQGERTRTTTNGVATTYTNAALGVSGQTTSGATTYWTRTPGGGPVSQRNADGTRWYYLFDGLGSVVGLVDISGTVVARYGYDPYGQLVEKSGPAADGNPWRYTAGYWDAGVGLYKLGARYYDPARGRFTQLDPLGGGYVYARNNPVNFVDPSGLGVCGVGGRVDEPSEDPGDCGGGIAGRGAPLNPNTAIGGGSGRIAVIGRTFDVEAAKNWSGHYVLEEPPGGVADWWSYNKEWLDGIIVRGDTVYVASPQIATNLTRYSTREGGMVNTFFAQEIEYLKSNGYIEVGDYLVPGG